MLKLTMRLLTTATLTLGLAAPALAGPLYRWTADDGTVSFTDDAKRIPERYRSEATSVKTGGLARYGRFTPADAEATDRYRQRLYARLDQMRETRAAEEEARARAEALALFAGSGARPAGTETIVQVNNGTAVRIPTSGLDDEAGPIVVEELRTRPKGKIVTRHSTVVRQGDRILMIVKPEQDNEVNAFDVIDEDELEGR